MKFKIITFGCKVNQYESQVMCEALLSKGYFQCEKDETPDIIVINSCTVTSVSDNKGLKALRRAKRENPTSIAVLCGCIPQAFPDDERFEQADILLGNKSRGALVPSIEQFLMNKQRVVNIAEHKDDREFESTSVSSFLDRTRAFVKIEDGCNRFCSYCIIPYARGRVRSKPFDELKDELERLGQNGYKEVVLVGINLSAYGSDFNMTLADAVESACNVNGIERVRLGSLEPDRMDFQTIKRLSKQEKLCPQFHLSLQSGCDETLKRMNRHYTSSEYEEIVTTIKDYFENPAVSTDIMVGFPGETQEEFEQSLSFSKKIAFAKVHVFPYSRRAGTRADKMDNQLNTAEKERRAEIMIESTEKDRTSFLRKQVGRIEEVLFERRRRDGFFEGYTKNYTPVIMKSDKDISGEVLSVKLVSSTDSHCEGSL